MESEVPTVRIRAANDRPVETERSWVLYWMTAFRRTHSNFALQHARDLALRLQRPLLILEALRSRYAWASERFHRFIIQGMRDNQRACEQADVLYYPYVEPAHGQGSGLVAQLAQDACVTVTDDYPCFFHPRMIAAIAPRLPSRLEVVDSNCLMPLAVPDRTFTVAHSYRRWMQKELPAHLEQLPDPQPLDRRRTRSLPVLDELPAAVRKRWPAADLDSLLSPGGLAHLPIDHQVTGGAAAGGPVEAGELLKRFVDRRLDCYAEDRNEPDEYGSSELSPHLHFGHISPQQVFLSLMQRAGWNPSRIGPVNGKANGFWGVDENTEAFLDQLCVWREIGFNMCWREPGYQQLDSLPEWTQTTMREHAEDPREYLYDLEQFENAQTHDDIWNAAQRQLVREGRIHNYLRMLWGKKILHWTNSPQQALDIMIHLNNKYALDGRDPNSYSGIFWVLGRYDRAWGPERPIFGKIRYMTSENTAKKHKLGSYLERYSS